MSRRRYRRLVTSTGGRIAGRTIQVGDSLDGQPITRIEPYTGALGSLFPEGARIVYMGPHGRTVANDDRFREEQSA
jgi:hypothetical protein